MIMHTECYLREFELNFIQLALRFRTGLPGKDRYFLGGCDCIDLQSDRSGPSADHHHCPPADPSLREQPLDLARLILEVLCLSGVARLA